WDNGSQPFREYPVNGGRYRGIAGFTQTDPERDRAFCADAWGGWIGLRSRSLTLPAKGDSFFLRVVEGLSGLRRGKMRRFQFVIPLSRRIGIIDKHQGWFVA